MNLLPTDVRPASFVFRHPALEDGARVWELIRKAGTLDLNSAYCYMMLCTYFSDTCLLAENSEGELAGFVSAYRVPGRENMLFVWQIAVVPTCRGQGLGKRLLLALLERLNQAEVSARFVAVSYLEATISPSNQASRALFESVASCLGCPCQELPGMPAHLFPAGQQHEEERLYRIGPFRMGAAT